MSGEGEGGTCFKIWKKARTTVLVHKSPKLQMIDDPKVVITQYVVSAVVIVYFLFNIFQNFGYWKLETPYGSTNMWAEGYDASNDAAVALCEPSNLANYDFRYDETWTYYNNKCKQFTPYEVSRKLESGGFYIQTYVQDTVSKYEDCGEDLLGCRTKTTDWDNYFVPGVDDIEIFVEHGFTAVQRGVSKLMPKTTVWKKSGDWKDDKNKEEESFNERKPFKMKLKDLLKLAGIDSIDAPNHAGAVADSVGTPKYRMTGMVIELQIDYTNKIPGYYEGSEYVARASIAKAPIGWAGLGGATDFTSSTRSSAANATDGSFETYESYSYGVKIVVKATGEIGHFDFFFLMAVIVQLVVYWGLGVVAAEFVASSLLGEKSVDWVDDQRDYTHCENHPESTRGERPAHWTNREGWDKDQKPPPKATDTTV